MRSFILLVCMMWGLSQPLLAGSIEATVERSRFVLGDELTISVVVRGSYRKEPRFPEIDGLEFLGTNVSTSISIINGVSKRENVHSFVFQTLKEGVITIPSLELKIDGKIEITRPIQVRVESDSSSPSNEAAPVLVKRTLTKNDVYVGEVLGEEQMIEYRVPLADIGAFDDKRDGFKIFDIEGNRKGATVRNGIRYEQISLNKVLLPLREGKFKLPSVKYKVTVVKKSRARRDDFFGGFFGGSFGKRERKLVASKPQEINVKPLPTYRGRYKSSDLVGRFETSVGLERNKLKVGETTTLTITIEGDGLLSLFDDPSIDLGPEFKIYKDKPEYEEAINPAGIYSRKAFKFALIPTKEGMLDLGEFNFVFFDPFQEKYVEKKHHLGALEVSPGDEQKVVIGNTGGDIKGAIRREKEAVESLGNDIVDIKRVDILANKSLPWKETLLGAAVAFLLAGLGFYHNRQRSTLSRDEQNKIRRKKAFRRYRRLERAILKESVKGSDALVRSFGAFKVYLGDRFGLEGKSFSTADCLMHLKELNLGDGDLGGFKKVSEIVDETRFNERELSREDATKYQGTLFSIVKKVEGLKI